MAGRYLQAIRRRVSKADSSCTLTAIPRPSSLPRHNRIKGSPSAMRNSRIVFHGFRNTLVFDEDVILEDTTIDFNGDDSIVYLCKSRHPYRINVSMNHNCVFYMGQNNYMNGSLHVILSEQKHFFVGNEGLFSFDIWARTADPHLIYSCRSMERINPSRSIFLGDHVWVGQNVMLLKGSQVDSGSIIGAGAVLSGKAVPHNAIYAGNPAKEIRRGIFWEGSCVHSWKGEQSVLSQDFRNYAAVRNDVSSPEQYIYHFDSSYQISYNDLDSAFSDTDLEKKLSLLQSLSDGNHKERFVHTSD